ncbi:hypothetical protein Trydic_g10266, partial [Trypoxylus dichotomus]
VLCKNRYFWCKSRIVLNWIAAEPITWKTFVAKRVAEIQESSTRDEWRHIKSKTNPAHIVSREANSSQLLKSDLWWSGPKFLLKDKKHRPISKSHLFTDPDIPERRKEI